MQSKGVGVILYIGNLRSLRIFEHLLKIEEKMSQFYLWGEHSRLREEDLTFTVLKLALQ
jgi:hypothetical protein